MTRTGRTATTNDNRNHEGVDLDVAVKGGAMNLYLDIDGVLLGRQDAANMELALAKHADAFLNFALRYFDCVWLTTHCDGTRESVLRYLRPYCSEDLLRKLAQVRPARFRTLKTEALRGDFYWVEDAPLRSEVQWLKAHGFLDRWIKVDVRRRPGDLRRALSRLRAVLTQGPLVRGRRQDRETG